jgi:hypothetical protein
MAATKVINNPVGGKNVYKVMVNRAYLAFSAATLAAVLIASVAGCDAPAARAVRPTADRAALSAPDHDGPACRPSQLQLTAGPRISEATEQHTLLLMFRNISATTCYMRGYPGIGLADSAGRRLSFTYRRGGDQMLTSAIPAPVRLPPGGFAYSALNQNSCVSFTQTAAAGTEVTPPGQHEPLILTLPHYPLLDYCGVGDPGHTIDIAPVEPTSQAVLAFR